MPSESTVKPRKMQTGGSGGGGIQHPQPWIPDQRDGFIAWMRAEFAAANAIIDVMCHHMRSVGEPGEYDVVLGCVQQRRVSWNPLLLMQQFHYFPCTEIAHSLQQVEWRRRQRVAGQGRVGSREVQMAEATGETNGVECRNLKADACIVGCVESNRTVKEREEGLLNAANATDAFLNTQVDGSLKTSRNPHGANNPYPESQLKAVKDEEISNSDGSCDLLVSKNDLSIQNQNEDSLTISPRALHDVKTNEGNTVNVAEGLDIHMYEELLNQAEKSKLISTVNDLQATEQHGQLPGDVLYGGDYEANDNELHPTTPSELRFKWSHEEDLHLINAWLNTDKGVVLGPNKRPRSFWNRISDHYSNGKLDIWVGRGPNQCKSRWSKITMAVQKFVSCYEEASKEKTSEQSEDDVIRYAYKLYYNDISKDFILEYAWRALRSESKWRDAYLNVTGNTSKGGGGGAKRMRINEPIECSLSSSSTPPLTNLKRKGKRVEREGSDDLEASLECGMMKEEELKMDSRDERKMKMQRDYLLAKKYDLLSNLIAQSGALTSGEVMFKNKLVEDLLKA